MPRGLEKIDLIYATPAQILQKLLEEKWSLEEGDKDMIVMQHKFVYETKDGEIKKLKSSMITYGEDNENTAMALTVGLPAAIATKFILTGKIKSTGVQVPNVKSIYNPVLKELRQYKIKFIEEEVIEE